MTKDKSAEDTISEREYTVQMKSASTSPENDSPGDSEADADSEFEMGVNYVPDEKNDPEEIVDEDSILLDTEDSKFRKAKSLPKIEIPESAKVVSSDQPSHRMDRDTLSDTH